MRFVSSVSSGITAGSERIAFSVAAIAKQFYSPKLRKNTRKNLKGEKVQKSSGVFRRVREARNGEARNTCGTLAEHLRNTPEHF